MFGRFNSNNHCPVSEETRLWLANTLIWLIHQFGDDKIININTLIPTHECFPMLLDGTEAMAFALLNKLAIQMDVDPSTIQLQFYNEQLIEIRGPTGVSLYGQQHENEYYSAALYGGKVNGKFSIALEKGVLKHPDRVVATLALKLHISKSLAKAGYRKMMKRSQISLPYFTADKVLV